MKKRVVFGTSQLLKSTQSLNHYCSKLTVKMNFTDSDIISTVAIIISTCSFLATIFVFYATARLTLHMNDPILEVHTNEELGKSPNEFLIHLCNRGSGTARLGKLLLINRLDSSETDITNQYFDNVFQDYVKKKHPSIESSPPSDTDTVFGMKGIQAIGPYDFRIMLDLKTDDERLIDGFRSFLEEHDIAVKTGRVAIPRCRRANNIDWTTTKLSLNGENIMGYRTPANPTTTTTT
jgi:hypothetical protein